MNAPVEKTQPGAKIRISGARYDRPVCKRLERSAEGARDGDRQFASAPAAFHRRVSHGSQRHPRCDRCWVLEKLAAQAGWEVLRNPKVAAEITRRQQLLSQRLEITAENVLSELAKVGFASLGDFYRVSRAGRLEVDPTVLADPAKAAALSQIEIVDSADGAQTIKIKLFDKRAALGDLAHHQRAARSRPLKASM